MATAIVEDIVWPELKSPVVLSPAAAKKEAVDQTESGGQHSQADWAARRGRGPECIAHRIAKCRGF